MKTVKLDIKYSEYSSLEEMCPADQALVREAIEAQKGSYAPYSRFNVGAAVLLEDGTVIRGSNQENAAYPSGLCAERTAIFAASSQRPELRDYEALAIAARDARGTLCEASPCGACRQVLAEYESLQGHPLRIVLLLADGRARVVPSVADLLPFSFAM